MRICNSARRGPLGEHSWNRLLSATAAVAAVSFTLNVRPCSGQDEGGTPALVRPTRNERLWLVPRIPADLRPDGAVYDREESPARVRPQYQWLPDVPLVAAGATLLAVGSALSADRRKVPPEGLDPNNIHLGIDRNSLGEHSTQADNTSDYFGAGATSYPLILAFASQPAGARLSGTLQRSLMYAEALAISEGISTLVKRVVSRPRPYTYLSDAQRPDNRAYDVTAGAAFESMPSGHAVTSFTGAAFALTDHLLTRPTASWQEQAGVAAIGGFLAGMTSSLRVEAGQHFATDTFVGGLIGTTSGVAIPLLHHYLTSDRHKAPMPSARSWTRAFAGELIGVGAGILTTHLFY